MAIIKTFYREYEIEIPRIRIGKDIITARQLSTDIPGREEIKFALTNCNKKYQAIILLMASSGMSKVDIRHLTVQDFKNSLDFKGNITEIGSLLEGDEAKLVGWWKGLRYKTSVNYFTYSSPESTKAIIDYLSTLPKQQDDDDPLFPAGSGRKMISDSAFVDMFQVIDTRCNFPRISEKKRFLSSHKLRKFFGTTLISCKIDKIYVDWLMGHKINSQDAAYFKANPGAVKSEYLKALQELTVLGKIKVRVVTDGTEELEKQSNEQKSDIDYLKKMISENPYLQHLNDPEVQKEFDEIIKRRTAEKTA